MADLPRASVIVAVGDEILGGFTLDTNSHWLAGRLREAGYPCARIEVVPDPAPERGQGEEGSLVHRMSFLVSRRLEARAKIGYSP